MPNQPLIITEEAAREMERAREVRSRRVKSRADTTGAAPLVTDAANQGQNPDLVAQFERRWQAGFGPVGGYNSFWVDTGEHFSRVDGKQRIRQDSRPNQARCLATHCDDRTAAP